MKTYKTLKVWEQSIEMVEYVYVVTRDFPSEERYGLTSQMRRASISIPSNIAEGYGRASSRDSARFVDIAIGSATELETQFIIAQKLEFLSSAQYTLGVEKLTQILKMLYAYKKYLLQKG
jgi:four helix bundle protein